MSEETQVKQGLRHAVEAERWIEPGGNRRKAWEQQLADRSECWVTVHPSALLRMPDPDRRREERARFVADLKRIRKRAAELARPDP